MGFRTFGVAGLLLLVGACGGTEFSAVTTGGGGESGTSGETGGASGNAQGTSGSAGTTTGGSGGSGGAAGGKVDASVTGGSGGQLAMDAGPRPDGLGGSGGVVDASSDVVAPDAGVPTCPATEPAGGGACSGVLKCTYGTHPRIACRKTYTCSSGQWATTPSAMCPDLDFCQPPYPQVNFSCTNAGYDCIWDSGLYCRCLACPDMGCPRWNCFPPPNGCGTTPPNLGQPCNATTTPAVCAFGDCSLGTRVTVTCEKGIVNWTFPNCQ